MDFIGTDDLLLMAVYGLVLFAPWVAAVVAVLYLVRMARRGFRERE